MDSPPEYKKDEGYLKNNPEISFDHRYVEGKFKLDMSFFTQLSFCNITLVVQEEKVKKILKRVLKQKTNDILTKNELYLGTENAVDSIDKYMEEKVHFYATNIKNATYRGEIVKEINNICKMYTDEVSVEYENGYYIVDDKRYDIIYKFKNNDRMIAAFKKVTT